MRDVRLIATDLDGTFLRNDHSVSSANRAALELLGRKGIVRVAATGRNLSKVRQVIAPELPFDYVVFSSGAGVFDWQAQKHLNAINLREHSANLLLRFFSEQELNFFAFFPVPDNHRFYYFRGKQKCDEFERYLYGHEEIAHPLNKDDLPRGELCQFLLIIPEDEQRFTALKTAIEALCSEIRVIRATSPISRGYIWIEVFNRAVSKAAGVNFICEMLGIAKQQTIGLGNDYNDFDLLDFTTYSFLTDNAPESIKHKYNLMPTNQEDAFAYLVNQIG